MFRQDRGLNHFFADVSILCWRHATPSFTTDATRQRLCKITTFGTTSGTHYSGPTRVYSSVHTPVYLGTRHGTRYCAVSVESVVDPMGRGPCVLEYPYSSTGKIRGLSRETVYTRVLSLVLRASTCYGVPAVGTGYLVQLYAAPGGYLLQ
jgi:hypothetical protein